MIQKCPVCEGRGIVPSGFYNVSSGLGTGVSASCQEICRTCGGQGVINNGDVWSCQCANFKYGKGDKA